MNRVLTLVLFFFGNSSTFHLSHCRAAKMFQSSVNTPSLWAPEDIRNVQNVFILDSNFLVVKMNILLLLLCL